MKEHSVSRIRLIRHPSPANTHQSLSAHDLITKRTATAKQPGNFNGVLLMQTRRWQLFLLPGWQWLEDCRNNWVNHHPLNATTFHHLYHLDFVQAWFKDNTSRSKSILLLNFFFFFLIDSLHVAQTGAAASWPLSWRVLWTWSGRFLVEAALPLQRGGPARPKYGPSPQRRTFGSGWSPAINCHTDATRLVSERSS